MQLNGSNSRENADLEKRSKSPCAGSFALLRAALERGSAASSERVSELAFGLAAELRGALSVRAERCQRLEPRVWTEFSDEVSPYYTTSISPVSPNWRGISRFDRALKPVYQAIRCSLLEGRHRPNCQEMLGVLLDGELGRAVRAACPDLERVVWAVEHRGGVNPDAIKSLTAAAREVVGPAKNPFAREFSDAEKMMLSGYLAMPSLRSAFERDDINLALSALRPSVPPFPGQGQYPILTPSVAPLPRSVAFNLARELGELYSQLPEERRERLSGVQFLRRMRRVLDLSPDRYLNHPDKFPLPSFVAELLSHLPGESVRSLYPLLEDPGFKAACVLNSGRFDWIAAHAKAFGEARLGLTREFSRLVDACARNMLDEVRREVSTHIEEMLRGHAPGAERLNPIVREQLRWMLPRQDNSPEGSGRALILREPRLLRLFSTQAEPVVQELLIEELEPVSPATPQTVGHPTAATDRLLTFVLANCQSLASHAFWNVFKTDQWLGEEPIVLRGAHNLVGLARNVVITEEHRATFAAALYAGYVAYDYQARFPTPKSQEDLVGRALFPLEALRESVLKRPGKPAVARPGYKLTLPDLPDPDAPRDPRIGMYWIPPGWFEGNCHYLTSRCLSFDALLEGLGYSEAEVRGLQSPWSGKFGEEEEKWARALSDVVSLRDFRPGMPPPPIDTLIRHVRDARAGVHTERGMGADFIKCLSERVSREVVLQDERYWQLSTVMLTFKDAGAPKEVMTAALWAEYLSARGLLREGPYALTKERYWRNSVGGQSGWVERLKFGVLDGGSLEWNELVRGAFEKMANEHLPVEAFTPLDAVCIAYLMGLDRYSSKRPVADALLECVGDLRSGRVIGTPAWMSSQTVEMAQVPRIDPGSFWTKGFVVKRAIAQHERISRYLEKSWTWEPTVEDGLILAEAVAPEETFFRAIVGMDPYESDELENLKPIWLKEGTWARNNQASMDVRSYVEQLVFSLEEITLRDGSKIRFGESMRVLIAKALHLDEIIEEIGEIYRGKDFSKDYQAWGHAELLRIASHNPKVSSKLREIELNLKESLERYKRCPWAQKDGAGIWISGVNDLFHSQEFRYGLEDSSRSKEFYAALDGWWEHEETQVLSAHPTQGAVPVPAAVSASPLSVTFLPTRGIIMEFLGANSGSCIRRHQNLARTYSEATAVAFVVEKEHPKIMGGCLVFEGRMRGERVLVVRGFNPTYELLDQISAGSLFEAFADYLQDAARAGGFSAVVIPRGSFWHNPGTLRAPVFFHVQERYGDRPTEQLEDCQVRHFNDFPAREVSVIRRATP